jgi:hypothetical protein
MGKRNISNVDGRISRWMNHKGRRFGEVGKDVTFLGIVVIPVVRSVPLRLLLFSFIRVLALFLLVVDDFFVALSLETGRATIRLGRIDESATTIVENPGMRLRAGLGRTLERAESGRTRGLVILLVFIVLKVIIGTRRSRSRAWRSRPRTLHERFPVIGPSRRGRRDQRSDTCVTKGESEITKERASNTRKR